MPDGVENDQQHADEDQNEGEAHQHHYHPVLYAPTNDSEQESKNAFHDWLQAELASTPRYEMKIVMSD